MSVDEQVEKLSQNLPFAFKFQRMNDEGQSVQIFSSKGLIEQELLTLGKKIYSTKEIAQVAFSQTRVVVVGFDGKDAWVEKFLTTEKHARKIKQILDGICSQQWSKNRQEALNKQTLGHEFRTTACPHCEAIIDLSGFKKTPQTYCYFCETIFDSDSTPNPIVAKYRLCQQCGFYSQPRLFTSMYIIFLLVFVHYQWETKTKCHVCMRSSAWKMFWGNLLFVLGLPYAIFQLIRSYQGAKFNALYPGLETANAHSVKKRVEKATEIYEHLLELHSPAAGIHYNIALAHAGIQSWDDCIVHGLHALDDCSNYNPAANLIASCLQIKGMQQEAEKYASKWGLVPGETQQQPQQSAE